MPYNIHLILKRVHDPKNFSKDCLQLWEPKILDFSRKSLVPNIVFYYLHRFPKFPQKCRSSGLQVPSHRLPLISRGGTKIHPQTSYPMSELRNTHPARCLGSAGILSPRFREGKTEAWKGQNPLGCLRSCASGKTGWMTTCSQAHSAVLPMGHQELRRRVGSYSPRPPPITTTTLWPGLTP